MVEESSRRWLSLAASHGSAMRLEDGAHLAMTTVIGHGCSCWREARWHDQVDGGRRACGAEWTAERAKWQKRIMLPIEVLGIRSRQWPVHAGRVKLNTAENSGLYGSAGTRQRRDRSLARTRSASHWQSMCWPQTRLTWRWVILCSRGALLRWDGPVCSFSDMRRFSNYQTNSKL
jgi:hypothetical protein